MNRHALSWFAVLAPVVILMAVAVPNAEAIAMAWKTTGRIPLTAPFRRAVAMKNAIGGCVEAKRDIRAGKLIVKEWGLMMPASLAYQSYLKARIGVTTTTVAGCVVSEEQMAGWIAYNNVMIAEIDRRAGPHAMERVSNDWRTTVAPTMARP